MFTGFLPLIIIIVVIGTVLGVGFALIIISSILKKSNILGDDLPTLSDYSTDRFASSFYGKNYGKTKNKIKDL